MTHSQRYALTPQKLDCLHIERQWRMYMFRAKVTIAIFGVLFAGMILGRVS